ncbi:MAG: prepilin-type N-terminal cleavage/methylation domain-containing protein, partial [Oscillospiraceae bacterium]|nr:prepilin-type N-terminal cleavage/methylation domain-containing protein [Oscillospiraceae bacterium]
MKRLKAFTLIELIVAMA